MHQDRKMTRSSSVADVDIKPPSPTSSSETRRSKHQKLGPHPQKKMLRSHSESAIDVNLLRGVMKHSSTTSVEGDRPKGIVCSNEDFKQIITESKRHRFGRKRNNTMVIQLESTPEVPQEGEIVLDNRLVDKKDWSAKQQANMPEIRESRERATKLPLRQCAGSDPNSPAHLSESKRDNVKFSPLLLHKNNVNNASIRSIHLSPKALANRLTKCDVNRDELEPMLPKDKNGNHIIAKEKLLDELADEEHDEFDTENIPTNIDNENAENMSSDSAFDAQLLGEAIERHLAMQRQSSPGRKSPRCGEGRKRSGSLKAILGQNNAQISSRLGSLISRFPFRRDGSVSPTDSDSGVTV